jgi:hypothetical protein
MMAEGKKVDPRSLNQTFTKSDRIDRMFNDILTWRKR